MSMFTLAISFDHFQFTLIHGPDILGSYAILLFTASNLASITSYIHNWVLFLLWLHPFILSGVISPLNNSTELFSPIPVHLSSLIPRMSMFTLVISCLTTSNLPWFMDLKFQIPMPCGSLQHQILLLSPVPSTTGWCFCFGSIPSSFLELFLHWSPLAYWATTDLTC